MCTWSEFACAAGGREGRCSHLHGLMKGVLLCARVCITVCLLSCARVSWGSTHPKIGMDGWREVAGFIMSSPRVSSFTISRVYEREICAARPSLRLSCTYERKEPSLWWNI